jgi:alkylation response protein AidB-like acyl-CoA dehydrogenase
LFAERPAGLAVAPQPDLLGGRCCGAGRIVCEGLRVAVPAAAPEEAPRAAAAALEKGEIARAAVALGVARAALAKALAYAQEREQFGQPIANLQAIQWMLAESATEIEAAALLIAEAAWRADAGEEPAGRARAVRERSAAAAARACSRAVQIHGGYGYIREYGVERHLRDAQFLAAS